MIYIYNGIGASQESIDQTIDAFQNEHYDVKLLSEQNLLEGSWTQNAKLFVMPGGADVPYVKKLKGKGNQIIDAFVKNGGSYLGLCAGAYYASNYVEFDKDGKLEVLGKRELLFFPGKTIGPLLAPYDYSSKSGARAAQIQIPESNLSLFVYFSGGPYFENTDKQSDVQILANYILDGKKLPAIVKMNIGKGKVILSGVHFEYDPERLDQQDPHLQDVIPTLKKSNQQRLELVRFILNQLNA